MKIIKPSVEIIDDLNEELILNKLELAGRTCYKSEDRITKESSKNFIKMIMNRKHESVLEHVSITVKFIVDRGVTHQIVRHRIASYSQESTRYCNYSKGKFNGEITVIEPLFLTPNTRGYELWRKSCEDAEKAYFELLDWGCSPQEARSVLPNSLKSELIVTMNIRSWLNFLNLRTASDAHPQIIEASNLLVEQFKIKLPTIFKAGDYYEK